MLLPHVEYETDKRHYAHVDCPGHADYVKNMILVLLKWMEQSLLSLLLMVQWRKQESIFFFQDRLVYLHRSILKQRRSTLTMKDKRKDNAFGSLS